MNSTTTDRPLRLPADFYRSYREVGELAKGGMAEIRVALHRRLEIHRAVKIPSSAALADPQARQRFWEEARLMGQLHHPNLLSVVDAFLDEDAEQSTVPVMVMELIRGGSLEQLIEAWGGPLPLELVIELMSQLMEGLDYLHRSWLHRDICPANVLLGLEGGRAVVKLIDYGIAKSLDDGPSFTTQGRIWARLQYCAPERLRAERLDERSDLFSAAATMWHCLTGRRPESLSPLHDRCWPADENIRCLDPELRYLLTRALEADREQRPVNAGAFLRQIQPYRKPLGPKLRGRLVTLLGQLAWKPGRAEPSGVPIAAEVAKTLPDSRPPHVASVRERAHGLVRRAARFHRQGRVHRALVLLGEAERVRPGNVAIRHLRQSLRSELLSETLSDLEVSQDSVEPVPQIDDVLRCVDEGVPDRALALALVARRRWPRDAGLLKLLGHTRQLVREAHWLARERRGLVGKGPVMEGRNR